MILCATCRHNPGRGRWCSTGHRHATAHRKHCDRHRQHPNSTSVQRLRHLAAAQHRAGSTNEYALLLHVAHDKAERLRRW